MVGSASLLKDNNRDNLRAVVGVYMSFLHGLWAKYAKEIPTSFDKVYYEYLDNSDGRLVLVDFIKTNAEKINAFKY